jgi:hypothetical protein
MSQTTSDEKSCRGALGFLAVQALVMLVLQIALGGAFMLKDHPNAFSGVNLVVALYTAPVLMLAALPVWLLLYFKSASPKRLALLVSVLAVMALQLFLRSAPPAGAAIYDIRNSKQAVVWQSNLDQGGVRFFCLREIQA